MKKVYGYARVSTKEQHLDRQMKALLDAHPPESKSRERKLLVLLYDS